MEKIRTTADLKRAIEQAERKQAGEWLLLKEQLLTAYQSVMPLNMLKNTFKEVASSPGVKDSLLSAAMGLTAGYLSNALIIGASRNPIKRLFGAFLQSGVSTVVSKNSEAVKALTRNMVNFFSKKKEINVDDNSNGHSV